MSTVKFTTVYLCLIAILIRVSSPSAAAAAAAAAVPDDVGRTHIRGPKLSTSGTGNKTSKSAVSRVDPKLECGEMESRSECGQNLKCRWCRSDALDDMCFPKSEASRLPSQIFTCQF